MNSGNPHGRAVYLFRMSMRLAPALAAALLLASCSSAPPYQGVEADELFAIAMRALETGDHGEAERALDRFILSFPTHQRATEARMMLADFYFQDEQYITAISEYQRFLDRHPTHPSASDAALGRCRGSAALSPTVQRDQSYTEEAEEVCRNVTEDYAGTPAAAEAARIAGEMRLKLAAKLYEIGEYYFQRNFNDSAIIYWEMVEEQYADTSWAPKALLGIMNAYDEIGYQDLVQETRQKILDTYPNSEEARGLVGAAQANGGR